jgi:hypothetical protein
MQNQLFEQLQTAKIICKMALLCKTMETVFTTDEGFMRPWQPLKGIPVYQKHIYRYVRALSYPTTTKKDTRYIYIYIYIYKGDAC